MARHILVPALLLLAASGICVAADAPAAQPAAKPYPLDTCLVTGEKLGGMGAVVTLVKDGQEWKFCCKGCIKDFEKDPKKYADQLAAEVAKKTKGN